ncbi:MAG: hypothetical protein IJJ63_02280 [Bacilli bacterium]|nr:hypothetical protein [Bacilli bacterium]
MNFDYEKAKALLISVLNEKREEAKEKGNELRVRNIDILLGHDGPNDYLEKLLDIALLSDIARFVESAERHVRDKGITTMMTPYCFFFSEAALPLVNIGARCLICNDGNIIEFSSPEDMRDYLYGVVGFKYQSFKGAKDAKKCGELIDPLASFEEVTYGGQIDLPNLFNLIDNLEELKAMPAPVHVQSSVIKTK